MITYFSYNFHIHTNKRKAMKRAVKVRLYPNKEQQELLQKHFGATRYIYNRSLALKKYTYQKFGINITSFGLIKRLVTLKERHSWLKEIDSQALQQSIRHLDEAFKHFFRRVKNGETPGFPKFKSKKYHKQSFQYPQRVKIKGNKVYLPKIGWIKAKGLRDDLIGKIKTVTISYEAYKYYASILLEIKAEPVKLVREPIGIDVGVVHTITDSNGNHHSIKNYSPKYENELKKLIKLQKALARKQRGSKNYQKAKIKLSRQYKRVSNIRYNFLHQVSYKYSENQAIVEDLNIKAMSKSAKGTIENPGKNVKAKAGLNRSILQNAWGMFFTLLEYKTNHNLIKVNPKQTSQTCSRCGYVDKENRVSQSRFVCKSCGFTINADVNAAKNILVRGIHGNNACHQPKVA